MLVGLLDLMLATRYCGLQGSERQIRRTGAAICASNPKAAAKQILGAAI
jgi:hypothetical protein